MSLGDRSGRGQRGHGPLHPVRNMGRQDGERQNSGQQPGMRRLGGQTEDCLSDSSAQAVVEEIPPPVWLSHPAARLCVALCLCLTVCLLVSLTLQRQCREHALLLLLGSDSKRVRRGRRAHRQPPATGPAADGGGSVGRSQRAEAASGGVSEAGEEEAGGAGQPGPGGR